MIKVILKTGNAAFEAENYGPEVARILRDLADQFEVSSADDLQDINLRDINGNKVGEASSRC